MKTLRNQLSALADVMTMALLTSVSIPVAVHAQSEMRVNMPFDFYIDTRKLSGYSIGNGLFLSLLETN